MSDTTRTGDAVNWLQLRHTLPLTGVRRGEFLNTTEEHSPR